MSSMTEVEAAVILIPYIAACFNASDQEEVTLAFLAQVCVIARQSADYYIRTAATVGPSLLTIVDAAKHNPDAKIPLGVRIMLN